MVSVPVFLPEVLPAVEVGWRIHPRCPTADKHKAGDRVLVQVGFDEVEARVLEVYGPNDSRLLLTVPIHGSEGEVLDERTVSLHCDGYCAGSPLA